MTFTKTRLIAITGLLLLVVLVQVLYDPISSARHSLQVLSVRNEFSEARAKWETMGITDYMFEIHGNTPSICQASAIVEVENDVVVKVEIIKDGTQEFLAPDRWADPGWGDEVFLCNYAHITMPRIFDLLERSLHNSPFTVMHAEFDPEYGFVTTLRYGLYTGYGLLRPHIDDCCSDLQIENFQPIYQKVP
jgi:hypothetical protein